MVGANFDDIESIHNGTAIYTSAPEIERLLDLLGWPSCKGRLIDPACGDGNMIIAALRRLETAPDDKSSISRVRGFEFHSDSVHEARERVEELLISRGWSLPGAKEASLSIIEERDFLLEDCHEQWDIILANPPYWRKARLPAAYRAAFEEAVPTYANGDLLHAYVDKMLGILEPGGRMALITSDRWLINAGTANLRAQVGASLKVSHVSRLDTKSAFHRPKRREKDTPPRVHAVSMILECEGRIMSSDPFVIDPIPDVDGIALENLATIRLAPWLGPDGIFLLDSPDAVPGAKTVPCVLPRGIDATTGEVRPPVKWAIVTGDEPPPASVMEHLEREMPRMPKRGRRDTTPWIPPERFDKHLPLPTEAILIPRIATSLKPVRLPAGSLPVNHSLVLVSGIKADDLTAMLNHPLVQAQADALAPRVESGYRSYTATLLRQLIIPHEVIPAITRKAA